MICVMVLALFSARANATAEWPGVTHSEIKIGATFPFSGPASAYATTGKGLIAYIEYLNGKGGVNGRKINFIAYDDAYSPPKAVEQTRRLVENDGVAFIFGSLGTPTNAATIKYLNAKKVPDLFIISGGSKFTDFSEFPYTTTGIPSYETEGRIYAKYISETLPKAKIALLYQNDDLGRDFLNALKFQFKDDFADRVATASYEVTEPTIDSQIVRLKSSGADVLVIGATPKFAAQALRKANELNWRPLRILNVVSSSIAATLKPAGLEASTGVVSATYLKDAVDPKYAGDSGIKLFREIMAQHVPGADLSDLNYAGGMVNGMILEQVLKQCGDDLSRENVLKQSRSLKNLKLPLVHAGILVNTSGGNSQAFTQLLLQRFNGTSWESMGNIIGVPIEQDGR
ncbi:ABC transporter substrate-binding protein [Bradyrhizobium sp. KB893862 SZCCT0404]|nr:ABC transporter substrate-binding protein [Bradyrhizobium sp. KB893862 SZCCT0404]MBR1177132.1 ABC transporter substrate-binding protein [Bradyrhizobium sp. KB893862 SZCCT0404]